MEKGKAFLAATLALAAGIGGGMMAGVKTAQTKEEQIKNEAVEQAEQKGYEAGLQASIVVNQGYSQEELDQAVEQAEAEKQKIIDALSAENQTLTDKNTNLDQLNQNLQQQIEAGAKVETVTPGLYNYDGTMTKTWDDLIQEGIISLDETGSCKMNIDIPSSGYKPMNIEGAMEKLDMLQGKLVFSTDVKRIQRYGFAYATGLNEVVIPESVTMIDQFAFAYCGIEKVTLPESISQLPASVFSSGYHNYNNEILVIPNSVTSILSKTFDQCHGIVFVPATVTSVNAYSFGSEMTVLFEADSVPCDVGLKSNPTIFTGISRNQVEFYNTMIKGKNILTRTNDGTVVFQDGSKVKFYNLLEESLVTWGTESSGAYACFPYSELDFILNNADVTYVYISGTLQAVQGLHAQLMEVIFADRETGIYARATDGIYKINTDVESLSGDNAYQKVFDNAIDEFTLLEDGTYKITANNEAYILDVITGSVTSLN